MVYNQRSGSLRMLPYDREKAVAYAHRWALGRNPRYFDFEKYGGDCTNFASQVVFAGSGIMNYTKNFGWYYSDSYNRTASWTGVDFLYNFLINNKSVGPHGELVDAKDVEPGDIIQLSFEEGPRFHHSPVVVQTGKPANVGNIRIAAHTFDRDDYPLTNYIWQKIRFIHISNIRSN